MPSVEFHCSLFPPLTPLLLNLFFPSSFSFHFTPRSFPLLSQFIPFPFGLFSFLFLLASFLSSSFFFHFIQYLFFYLFLPLYLFCTLFFILFPFLPLSCFLSCHSLRLFSVPFCLYFYCPSDYLFSCHIQFPFLSSPLRSLLPFSPLSSPLPPLQPDRSHYLHKGRFMIDSTFNPLHPRCFSDHASFAHKTSRPLVLAKSLDVNVEVMMNHFTGGIIISTRYQSRTRTPNPPFSIETRPMAEDCSRRHTADVSLRLDWD